MKNNILLVLVFISGAVFGGFAVGGYLKTHTPAPAVCAARPAETDLLLARLEDAALPNDVTAVEDPAQAGPQQEQIPSQLVRSAWPEDLVLGSTSAQPAAEKPAGIVLDDAQTAVVLSAQKPAHRAADGSSITMIEAPVTVKRISTLADYKAFKHTARGSYPAADFTKEEVIVLESASNLPDKVFEIVEIVPAGEQLKVFYRVNVFGLDKKTNTHSAQKITKTALPLVLEQVL